MCVCMCFLLLPQFVNSRMKDTHTHAAFYLIRSSTAGPLPNLHIASASPPILLNYYLLKSKFYLCYPRLKREEEWGCSYMSVCSHFFSSQAWSFRFPVIAILKPSFHGSVAWGYRTIHLHLCLPTQPLATGNFIYQLEPTRGRDPQPLSGRC